MKTYDGLSTKEIKKKLIKTKENRDLMYCNSKELYIQLANEVCFLEAELIRRNARCLNDHPICAGRISGKSCF